MTIAIPAIIDTQIATLRALLEPHATAATNTAASSRSPIVEANRLADLIDLLMGLIDSGTLTCTTGAETDGFTDAGAFTGVNSLVGATFTYGAATPTVALRDVVRTVQSNTVNKITFSQATVANQAGGTPDVGVLTFASVDTDIAAMRQGKALGFTAPNPYGPGPSIANAALKVLAQLGAALDLRDSGTTDGAGVTTTLVTSGMGAVVDAYVELWAYADTTGALDVDNLRKISTNSATVITAKSAFTVVATTPTAPGAGTLWEVRSGMLFNGTAAAGAALTMTMPATIDFALNELAGVQVVITGGVGIGQRRVIASNTAGVSSVVTVTEAWDLNPDATSTFEFRDQSAAIPTYLGVVSAEPFGLCSPHGGGDGVHGHAGATLMSNVLQWIRDAVAAYTAPA